MLDQGRIADFGRNGDRLRPRAAAGGGLDVLRQIPVVVLEHLRRHRFQGHAVRHRDYADGAVVLVGVVAGDAIVGLERIARADALVVRNDQHVVGLVQHHRTRRIGHRNHAHDRVLRTAAEVDDRDRVGVVQRDIRNAAVGVDGDRIRRSAVGRPALPGHRDRQAQVDGPYHFVGSRVDDRNAIAVSIGHQQELSEQRHSGRVQAGRDGRRDLHRLQIDHGDRTGDCGAHHRIGDDRGAGGVNLEIRRRSGAAAFVADIGGRTRAADHHAVRRVPNADLQTLRRRRDAEVDLREGIVLVQQGVGTLAVVGECDAAGVRSPGRIERAAGRRIGAGRTVREARDEGIIRRHADLRVVGQQSLRRDVGEGDVAAVLAEHQVLAVRRISDAAVAAAGIESLRQVGLQDLSAAGIEYLDGLRRAQGEDGGGVTSSVGVQCDGLGADLIPEPDLRAGRRDDRAIAHHPGAVRLRSGDVSGVKLGRAGKRRNGHTRRQQAGERAQTVEPRFASTLVAKFVSGHV